MKKILITLLLALAAFSIPRAQAEVSLSFFYDSLQDDGDWFEADDYGYCWQPHNVSSDWSPYSDGYWTYTDAGWTWVSYESFGWATYHYGRWANIRGRGWVWVPGYEWGPAWVSWRSNDDYVGWAPLPARAAFRIGITIGSSVDYDYDIGPSYYNFTSCRRFGSPSLRQVIVDRSENITIINQTTNITNITYQGDVVYNGGPDYERINRRSERPIERLKLERITRLDGQRDNRFSRRENGRLAVVAPAVVPVEASIRPRNVKASLGKVEADSGWSSVRDAKLAQQTREKIREENKGRTRAPVDRNKTVAQALREEARQKPVASLAEQPANIRPAKVKGVDNRETNSVPNEPRKPSVDRRPQAPLATGEKKDNPQTRPNAARQEAVVPASGKPVNPARSERNNDEKMRQREAAQAAVQRERAQAQREQAQALREQSMAQRERAQANAARQDDQAAARRANQEQAQQESRAREQRQAAAQQERQQQRRQQAEEQPVRREAPPQREARPDPRPRPRTQVQPSRERTPEPASEEADPRKKKKNQPDNVR